MQPEIEQQKVLLQSRGPSDGRPLLIIRVSRHFPHGHPEEVERFVIFCLEAASKLVDQVSSTPSDGKMWAIFDLNDVKWVNLDRHALFSCFHLLNCHFPERIHKIFMLDAPIAFYALWKLVSPFIDPVTKKKVAYISGNSQLLTEVDPTIVPEAYGGTAEEIPVEVAVRVFKLQSNNDNNSSQLDSPKVSHGVSNGVGQFEIEAAVAVEA